MYVTDEEQQGRRLSDFLWSSRSIVFKEGVALGASIMNQIRVEGHFGVEDKVPYQGALVHKGTTVNRKLTTAPGSFQLVAVIFEIKYHHSTKRRRSVQQSSWLPKERAFPKWNRE